MRAYVLDDWRTLGFIRYSEGYYGMAPPDHLRLLRTGPRNLLTEIVGGDQDGRVVRVPLVHLEEPE